MTVTWTDALDNVDWNELSELYRKAPLGNKSPERLKTVFTNSMFRRFGYEDGVLVAAGRALADGMDCSYICDVAILPGHQGRLRLPAHDDGDGRVPGPGQGRRPGLSGAGLIQYCLYGRNLPDSTTLTRSPFGSGCRTMSMLKSMALMIPSPNSSWISSLIVVP
jgi:hypothetical protein